MNITQGKVFVIVCQEKKEKEKKMKTEINKNVTIINTPHHSFDYLCQFQDINREVIFLLKDSKNHKLGLLPHNDNCFVKSLSNHYQKAKY